MKKVLCFMIMMCTFFTSVSYALTTPETISDLDFMKANYYKGANYTFKNIQVGGRGQGSVGSVAGYNPPNTDVYTLTVLKDSLVSIKVVPLSKQYYNNLTIDSLLFVDDVSGQKAYYSVSDQKNGIGIDDFGGYGSYYRSTYLKAGTYYFSVTGKAYSAEDQVTNHLSYIDYQIEVTSADFQNEANVDTDQSNPYTLKATNDVVSGTLRMNLLYNSGSFTSDSNDRIMIPSGSEREVTLKVHNIHSNPLGVFKKEIEYSRNNTNKKALETRTLTNQYKSDATLSVSIEGNGSFKILPNEYNELSFTAKQNEDYYIDLSANYPTQYKIEYAEKSSSTSPGTTPTVTNQVPQSTGTTYKPIIMLHTANADILPASILDNREYTIYVNNVNDLPPFLGPFLMLVFFKYLYAILGTMVCGAGGLPPRLLCGLMVL